jgi:hypothetical protein
MVAKPADDGWQNVSEESATRIIFDSPGDVFTGTYLGHELVGPDKDMDYLMFRGENDDVLYSTSAGYKLTQAFEDIAPGTLARITFVKEVDMGPGRNPMKDYRVDVKAG